MNSSEKHPVDMFPHSYTISKTKIKNGKSLIELTTYDDIAMWRFVEGDFDKFVRFFQSTEVPIYMKTSLVDRLIKKSSFLYFIYELFASHSCRLNVRLYDSKTNHKKNRIIVATPNLTWRIITDPFTKESKKGDAFFDLIISRLRKNDVNEIITTYPLGYSISGIKVIMDKRKSQKDIVHKPFDIYWSLEVWRKERKANEHFSDLWEDLKNDEKFKNLLEYQNVKFDLLEDRLAHYFITVFGIMVGYIEMAKRMIEAEKPDLILLMNENGRFERALVIAGKLKGVPTLAVQHGIITPFQKLYIYAQDEISPKGSVKSPHCPIPDITAVYGTYHKDLLTKVSAYPADSVVVTGQPRYDSLYHANKVYSKEEFIRKYKINSNNKLVLWATSFTTDTGGENIKNFKTVFGTIQSFKDITLIIKQHPMEECTQYIKDYLSNYNISTVITPRDSDTYEQLFVCDLMITKNSTTTMEAIALNKPVIVLNLGGNPDVVDYVEQGVAFGVYKEEDLKLAIENLLKDDTELAKNRERYIENYLYKIDGKATERVIKLIEETIRKRDKQNVNL